MDGAAPIDRLTPQLRAGVEVTGGGELIWRPEVVVEAIRWAADQRLAILGIEVFVSTGEARGLLTRETSTEPPRAPGEPWAEFVGATAARATDAVRSELRRNSSPAPVGDASYFLATTTERDYHRVVRHART